MTVSGRCGQRSGSRLAGLTWAQARVPVLLPGDGVEEELERAFGLGAVLDAEAEEDDLSFAEGECDGGGFAFQAFCAFGVAGDEDILRVFGIPGDDGALDVGRRSGRLERDGGIDESRD